MHLSPDEEKQLIEKYKISVVGYETYYRRKNIEEFLSEFAFAETALSMAQIDFRIDMESGKNIILKNSHDIESILIHGNYDFESRDDKYSGNYFFRGNGELVTIKYGDVYTNEYKVEDDTLTFGAYTYERQ